MSVLLPVSGLRTRVRFPQL